MKQRMFAAGETITDVADLVRRICAGEWVMLHGKPRHPSFMSSMQLNTLAKLCRARRVAVAERAA